jgi:hypothetical protein
MMDTTRTVQGGAVEEIWPARWMAQAAYREGHTSGLWPGCWEAAIQHDTVFYHLDLSELILLKPTDGSSYRPARVALPAPSMHEIGAYLRLHGGAVPDRADWRAITQSKRSENSDGEWDVHAFA